MVSARAMAPPRTQRGRLLVLAPHPDDETLGAGALIRQSADEGWYAGTVYLTDGGASHPGRVEGARARLVQTRRREARCALSRLIGRSVPLPLLLGWRDAEPAERGSARWRATLRRLHGYCRRHRVGRIAVSAITDAHCDHVAAARLARDVAALSGNAIGVFEYRIWSQRPENARWLWRSKPLAPGIRRRALAAHRSQCSAALGPGFRLPFTIGWTPRADLLQAVA